MMLYVQYQHGAIGLKVPYQPKFTLPMFSCNDMCLKIANELPRNEQRPLFLLLALIPRKCSKLKRSILAGFCNQRAK